MSFFYLYLFIVSISHRTFSKEYSSRQKGFLINNKHIKADVALSLLQRNRARVGYCVGENVPETSCILTQHLQEEFCLYFLK